jgi:hypothetical protein
LSHFLGFNLNGFDFQPSSLQSAGWLLPVPAFFRQPLDSRFDITAQLIGKGIYLYLFRFFGRVRVG